MLKALKWSNVNLKLYVTDMSDLTQQKGSSGAAEMEIQRLRLESERSMRMIQQWKKMYDNLNQFCINELLNGANGPST